MWNNYLKTAFRVFIRNKSFSMLNLFGLAIGIATCIIIFLYAHNELTYDKHHDDYKRIFRIEKISNIYGENKQYARVPRYISKRLKKYEEIEAITRFFSMRPLTLRIKNKTFKEDNIIYIQPSFFDVFKVPILHGNPKKDMDAPYKMALPESYAKKFFGDENPIGQYVHVDSSIFEIVGVVKDPPPNTHAKYGILVSAITTDVRNEYPAEMRDFHHVLTYAKVHDWVDTENFENRISNLAHEIDTNLVKRGEKLQCVLRRIDKIHLHSNSTWEIESNGSFIVLYAIIAIGILILLTTCFNFINLSTANYEARSKEVGIRKAYGAKGKNLIIQFISESVLATIMAHILAMFLVEFSIDFINKIIGIQLTLNYLNLTLISANLFIILIIGVAAGIYPAFVLAGLNPIQILKKGWHQSKRGQSFRKTLIVCQFAISTFLIIGSLVIHKQINFMRLADTGFNKENKLVFQFPENGVSPQNYRNIKAEFLKSPSITRASISSTVPGRWRYYWRLWESGKQETNTQMINCYQGDCDFIPMYGLELIAGSIPTNKDNRENNGGWILNEEAVKAFGWNSPEHAMQRTLGRWKSKIRGVFKNYHFKGLQEPIQPLAYFFIAEDYRYITLEYSPKDIQNVLAFAQNKYRELFPDAAMDYFFLDKDFDLQYKEEKKISRLVDILTILGIFITCLGLLGMVIFILKHKKKEIGIKKVLGSSIQSIVIEITAVFGKLLALGLILAVPLAWLGAKEWLTSFAFQTQVSWWIFALSGIIVISITIITITYHTIKAAIKNPVDSIKCE